MKTQPEPYPPRADPRTAERELHRRVDFADEKAIREMRADLRVAEQELRDAVGAVGDDWLSVRAYIQERATRATDQCLSDEAGNAKAGPGHPGQHGQKDADQAAQSDQFASSAPDPAKSQDKKKP